MGTDNKRLKWLFIAFIQFVYSTTYARAGGGSGGSAYGKGIGAIISLTYLAILLNVIKRRNKKAQRIIAKIHETDPLWDYDKMMQLTKDVFASMQNAWMERDMNLVKDVVTKDLFDDYQKKLDWMTKKKEKNIIGQISIDKVRFVGLEDRAGTENDLFTAYIKGSLVDYTVFERTGTVSGSKTKENPFSDLYYFKRHENNWLLNKIDNEVKLGRVLHLKEFAEQEKN